ncbi:MAG: DUF1570 domain-containing protein [Planctomycetaceae bacterium]|nr:DUF1570 domain-containing protein [Planctomycetaceae bacterium]
MKFLSRSADSSIDQPAWRLIVLSAAIVIGLHHGAVNAGDVVVELVANGVATQGRCVAYSETVGWLESQLGVYQRVDLAYVEGMRRLDGEYAPASRQVHQSHLRDEFGRDGEVRTIGHYVVHGPKGRVKAYADLLDEVYRSTWTYFSRRGFRLKQPEHQLDVVVFTSQADFLEYANSSTSKPVSLNLQGFYDRASNRIYVYDEVAQEEGLTPQARSNLIHEAVHQFCFNTGLLHRLADLPVWLVEGLALTLEHDGNRTGQGAREDRVAVDRLTALQQYRSQNPKFGLAEFLVADKHLFDKSVLDAYAVAWGATFYLMETRSADLTKYLRLLQERDPLLAYTPGERLSDLQSCFGRDLRTLEIHWGRFSDDLQGR